MSASRRRLGSQLLAALAVVAALSGSILIYAERTLFDSERFADRAVSVLDDEAVRDRLAALITDAAVEQAPNAIAARPLIESVASALVGSTALQSLIGSAVDDVHATVIEGRSDTLIVTLENIGVLVRQGLQAAAPQLADEITRNVDVELVTEGDSDGEALFIDAGQLAQRLEILHWIALAVALVAAASSIALARTRLIGVRRLGRSLAVGGIAAVALWLIGRAILAGRLDGDAAEASRALYSAFLGDLRTWLLVLAGAGVVVTAGASSSREPVDVGALFRTAWGRFGTTPASVPLRISRAVLLIAAGVLVLENRSTALEIAAAVTGALVVYVGAAELMRLAAGTVRTERASREEPEPDLSSGALARIAAVAAVLLGGFVLAGIAGNDSERPPLAVDTCNGSIELCDRPLDQVAFPATHNSMSAATYRNWFFAQHEDGMGAQLDAGIRGLLIDPHYGVKTPKGVATDLERDRGSREKIEESLGSDAIAAAENLRREIGYDGGGETETFLCHGFCELGAIRLERGLREVRDFLLANPGEVLVISIEDATSPEDTVAAIEASGLAEYAYRGPSGPWPTLREMIDRDERALIMAERAGGEPSWYREQFAITQETPFKFEDVDELEKRSSCRPNRGPADAPFFLLNNWVDTSPAPRPTNAKVVNTKRFLLDRVALCTKVRGVEPNVLAVDFFKQGDVVGAAAELNGVG